MQSREETIEGNDYLNESVATDSQRNTVRGDSTNMNIADGSFKLTVDMKNNYHEERANSLTLWDNDEYNTTPKTTSQRGHLTFDFMN